MTYHYDERDITDYVFRMRSARQFTSFNIEPQWAPGCGDIEGFCHDEVVRQFHDTKVKSDGGVRIEWMLSAWQYAQRAAKSGGGYPDMLQGSGLPTVQDILALGTLVEPEHNSTIGFRTMNVYIGNSMGAPPVRLKEMVPALVSVAHKAAPIQGRVGPHPDQYRANWGIYEDLVQKIETADDWYLAYEAIHPFADGNGRTGKILHNWLLGSLDEPTLVQDYFHGGNP